MTVHTGKPNPDRHSTTCDRLTLGIPSLHARFTTCCRKAPILHSEARQSRLPSSFDHQEMVVKTKEPSSVRVRLANVGSLRYRSDFNQITYVRGRVQVLYAVISPPAPSRPIISTTENHQSSSSSQRSTFSTLPASPGEACISTCRGTSSRSPHCRHRPHRDGMKMNVFHWHPRRRRGLEAADRQIPAPDQRRSSGATA